MPAANDTAAGPTRDSGATSGYATHMPELAVVVVWALATARLVGLATVDEVSTPLRKWLIEHLDDRPRTVGNTVSRIISCPWCLGVYVGAVTALVFWWHATNPWLLVPVIALAFAEIAGQLTSRR